MSYKYVLVISMVSFLIIMRFSKNDNVKMLSIREARDIIDNIYVPSSSVYKPLLRNQTIPREYRISRTWSETLRNTPFEDRDEDFYIRHSVRFDIQHFEEVVRGIGFPDIIETVFNRLNTQSTYRVGKATFWVYEDGIIDSSVYLSDIFRAYELIMSISRPEAREVEYRFHLMMITGNDKYYSIKEGGTVGTPSNINSGRVIGNTVFIWRTEEILKVFIHEMVHLVDLDLGSERSSVNDRLSKILPVRFTKGSISSMHEAYTETVTKILYSVFLSQTRGISFNEELRSQTEWSLNKCAQVLYLNGIVDINDITLHQKTFMFEYYILHAILLWDAYTYGNLGTYVNFFSENSSPMDRVSISKVLSNIDTISFKDDMQIRLENVHQTLRQNVDLVSLKMSK